MASPSGSFLDEDASVSMGSFPVEMDEEEEDEDLYYIPERRPSLDLGLRPEETGQLLYVERPPSPVLSYGSMRSEGIGSSIDLTKNNVKPTRINLERTGSFSSCYSVDSDDCEIRRLKEKPKDDAGDDDSVLPELKEDPEIDQSSLTIKFVFKAICKVLQQLKPIALDAFRMMLWQRYPQSFSSSLQSMDIVDIVDRMLECYSLQVCLQVTKKVLQELEISRLPEFLDDLIIQNEVRSALCERLKKIYDVHEISEGDVRPLDSIFTELEIKSFIDNCPNIEHEVVTIQQPHIRKGEEVLMKNAFSADWNERTYEQLILLSGLAGSGKSMIVKKLIYDWSMQKSHENITLMFPLPIKELKQKFGDNAISFLDILHTLYPETKKLKIDHYKRTDCSIMYVFDGLEEIAEEVDVHNALLVFDMEEPAKLSVLIANIFRGQLLRVGYCLMATRKLVDFYIPWDTHHLEYNITGFKEGMKDEYFKKRFRDKGQASRVIAYVKSSKTLHIMCHLPIFCVLVADMCQSIFKKQGPQAELPKGITYIYTKLFSDLFHHYYKDRKAAVDKQKFIMSLGKCAFSMLEKGSYHLSSYNKDTEEPVDEVEAITYSGLCTQFYIKPLLFVDEKIFTFLHPTMQEYLASLYVFLTCVNEDKNIFEQPKSKLSLKRKGHKKGLTEMYKNALEKSLSCEDGKLDMFMRFLFGLSNTSNNKLIQQYAKPSSVKWASVAEEAGAIIRKKMAENQYPARNKNLELCLEELGLSKSAAATATAGSLSCKS